MTQAQQIIQEQIKKQQIKQVTQVLRKEELESFIKIAFAYNPIKILDSIAQAGRSGVVWVYYQFEADGRRSSSFLSWEDLLTAFWDWVETVRIVLLSLDVQNALAKAIYALVEPGEMVWDRIGECWVEIVEKEKSVSLGLPRLWVTMDDAVGKISPLNVQLL